MPDRLFTVVRRAWGWHDAPPGTYPFLLSGALEGLSLVTVRLLSTSLRVYAGVSDLNPS